MQKLPADWKICATCSRWCGRQVPDVFRLYVEFDPNEKAKCSGGGFNLAFMGAMATCNRWEQRFRK